MNNRLSLIAAVLIAAVISIASFRESWDGLLRWDVAGYYSYLPATFIYDDIKHEKSEVWDALWKKYEISPSQYQFHEIENRTSKVDQYPAGMSVMYSPAFAIGHIMADEKDGFSSAYRNAIGLWSVLIAAVGIFFLRKILLYFFNDGLSALVLLLICGATNYYIQITMGLLTPHNYLFTLYAIYLWNVIRWFETKSFSNMIGLSIALGLACLSRPTEIIALLIPLFWTGNAKAVILELWNERRTQLITAFSILLGIGALQFTYWKITTGHFLFMSYANPAEGLDFLYPHTLDFLFSFRKGWLIYTPLAWIAMLAFIPLFKNRMNVRWSLLLFFLINIYVISSWSNWWYAQSYSQRPMVQSLPVMAILLGFALQWIWRLKAAKWPLTIVTVLVSVLTVFQSWQYKEGILDQWRMTKEYYFAVFGKAEKPEGADELLMVARPFDGSQEVFDKEKYKSLETLSFAQLMPEELDSTILVNGQEYKVDALFPEHPYTKAIGRKFKEYTDKDHLWLTIEADVFFGETSKPEELLLVASAEHSGKAYGYRTYALADSSYKPGEWNTIRVNYLTPEMRIRKDLLRNFLWYRGQGKVYCKDIRITPFERTK